MSFTARCFLLFGLIATTAATQIFVNENPEPPPLQRLLSRLPPVSCTPPFEAAGRLCLSFNPQELLWTEAEAACKKQSSHLTWMDSFEENMLINGFAASKKAPWHWIGLHRRNSTISWTGRNASNYYRGVVTYRKERNFFTSFSNRRKFCGEEDSEKFTSVCRQIPSNTEPYNLLNLILQIKRQTVNACPSPWVRAKHMCLMYFHIERTWREAETLCTNHGGALLWIEDEAEHKIIKSNYHWVKPIRIYWNFWIGLFKNKFGDLDWSGGFTQTPYRGAELINKKSSYFYASFDSLNITGAAESYRTSFACRRPM